MKSAEHPHLFVFAGEKSGDLHGGHLLHSLKKHLPTATFSGVAGPEMRKHEIRSILRMEDFEVMGFTDVLWALPKLQRQFYLVRDTILRDNPTAVILIDYPGFNLRLAKSLRKKGYQGKIIQYISPTVWAWGKKRIDNLAAYYDLLLTIYPFEQNFFSHTSLKVQFVGNPLQEYIASHSYRDQWKNDLNIPAQNPILALFPGSRQKEIIRNLPDQLQAAEMHFKNNPQLVLGVSCSSPGEQSLIEKLLQPSPFKYGLNAFIVPKTYTYELMRDSRTALAKSGTVTLELALHGRPTAVTYKLTSLNRFIAKYFLQLKLPYFCIVNILAEKDVFPEFIAKQWDYKDLYESLSTLDHEGSERQRCLQECRNISKILTIPNADNRAAQAIVEAIT